MKSNYKLSDFFNIEKIKQYLANNKITIDTFAKNCKLSTNTIKQILYNKNKRNCKINTAIKIATAMKIKLNDIIIFEKICLPKQKILNL